MLKAMRVVVVDIEEEWLHKPTKRCQTYFIDGQLANPS
jgi:hypothetical protein